MRHAPMASPTISTPIPQHSLPHSAHTHHREKVHFAGADSPSPPPPPSYETRFPSSSSLTSSTTSTTSTSPQIPSTTSSAPIDLQSCALHLLDTLYNKHDLALARTLIHPDVTVSTNNDDATLHSRDEYLAYWARRTKRVPDLRARCRECAVDEGQRKVWVVSELYMEPSWNVNGDGPSVREGSGKGLTTGRRKESVDMLWFDEKGRLVCGCDWVRSVRRREGDDD